MSSASKFGITVAMTLPSRQSERDRADQRDFTRISKKSWEYLWGRYQDVEETNVLVKQPAAGCHTPRANGCGAARGKNQAITCPPHNTRSGLSGDKAGCLLPLD